MYFQFVTYLWNDTISDWHINEILLLLLLFLIDIANAMKMIDIFSLPLPHLFKHMLLISGSLSHQTTDFLLSFLFKKLILWIHQQDTYRELAYLFVSVQRVDDELHHSIDLSFKLVRLGLLPQLFQLSRIQAIQLYPFLFNFGGISIWKRNMGY